MERTKQINKFRRIPDAINCSVQNNFTQISNFIFDFPELSFKAKGILCTLLRNRNGWTSYISELQKRTMDGKAAIESGIKELETYGFLWKINYVDKTTKRRVGSFWAYTDRPGYFDIKKELELLDRNNLEPWTGNKEKPEPDFLYMANLSEEKPEPDFLDIAFRDIEKKPLIILKDNNTKEKKNTNSEECDFDSNDLLPSKEKRNERFLPLAEKLSELVLTKKKIKISKTKLNQWANELRVLEEDDGIELKRQRKVLYEYSKIYNLEYVPEAESGHAFRLKFIRIEAAIERHKNPRKNNQQSKPTNRFMSKNNAPRDRIDVVVDNGVWTRLTNENGDRINV